MRFHSSNEIVPNAPSSQTTASAIHARLRRDILCGALKPGERLRVNDIAQRYGGGTIPTREALSRLTAELLVVYLDQRGFAVAPLSQEGLEDLTRARVWTAEVAVREAVRNGDAAWEERVLLAYHRLSKVSRYNSEDPPVQNEAYDPLHREFHLQLFSGCGSVWMVDTCMRLFDHAQRYRSLSRQAVVMPRECEHRDLVDAILQRRAEDAVALIGEHFRLTARIVIDSQEGD
ncbi:DNA-binding transcriptional regulator, GntR family [Paraburkholderia unamae]|uniref:GntR family transcriptional regulator n=1 Tax=Paraburkholderia unamae TaxID=219649 RepID=UPI001CB432DB|nr:FCD domain-containing protein [Paraburkholderia unamae]CAG9271574.1 DNA-binding transcriptional regulator, GntR family [Paraburkholderia unamae]